MNCGAILRARAHRPWSLPNSPWIMVQVWHDLLFAHWPIRSEVMRQHVPAELQLDTFAGRAWIGIVPFHMSNVRPRWMPALPGLSRFPELNVRTYVTLDNKPGIYFFSLDAGSRLAVWAARTFYHLPYFHARMRVEVIADTVIYSSRRGKGGADLDATFKAIAAAKVREAGSLEHWLTERYCLYTVHGGSVFRGEIHHLPWPLQDAAAEFRANTMAAAADISLPEEKPLLHFSKRQEALIWPVTRAT